jgi:nucleotide-binding universal stress UspA family protein
VAMAGSLSKTAASLQQPPRRPNAHYLRGRRTRPQELHVVPRVPGETPEISLAWLLLFGLGMKLICASDFSEPSIAAARMAAKLARRFGDDLLLVHAWSSPLLFYREVITDPALVDEKLAEKAAVELGNMARNLGDQGVTVEGRVVHDADAAGAITALAREVDARMIVVGAHSGRSAARLLVGSVAERTILTADRPVLVVHPGMSAEGWSDPKRPLRVVMGLDRSPASQAAITWLRTLRTLGPCDVTFVHVFWPVEQYARLGVRGTIDLAASDETTKAVLARELRPLFADLPGEGTAELRLRPAWGNPAETILDEAKAIHADLLILGTSRKGAMKRFWAGATVQPTVRAAELPVLCVPAVHDEDVAAPRPQLRNILVATDFSELGNRAVAYAYEMAGPGGRVTLCHVRERAIPPAAYAYVDNHDLLTEGQRRGLEDRLRALIPPEATSVPSQVSVIDGGQADTVIIQEANRAGADAICVGSHGRTGLARALMGSVAESVARRA